MSNAVDVRSPSAATLAFLNKLGCTETFDSQAAASAKIEELLRQRDTGKPATDKQHAALAALGGRPLPGAIHREISRVIAVLSALETMDLADTDEGYVDALQKLADVCRENFQKQPSSRARANAQSVEAPQPAANSGTADGIPF